MTGAESATCHSTKNRYGRHGVKDPGVESDALLKVVVSSVAWLQTIS